MFRADKARAEARKVLGEVATGHDPQGERVAARNAPREHSLRAMIDLYLADRKQVIRPGTLRASKQYLAGPYFQPLHKMQIDQITRADVASCLTKITNSNGRIPAAGARTKLSAFFVWAMQRGMVERNPVLGTFKPGGGQSRERVLDDTEIAAIWRECGNSDYGRVVRLLLLTGCRRMEVGGMKWSELNLATGSWTISEDRTKNGRAHTLPLPPMAMEIVRSKLPPLLGRNHLFGEYGTRGFSAWSPNKAAIDAKLGDQVKPWTIHDFRRTAATKMADIGIQPHIIEAILNHVSGHKGGIAGIYNRSSYAAETKTALLRWSEYLSKVVAERASNVLAFPATSEISAL